MKYDEAIQKMNIILSKLNDDTTSLEEAIELFEEGAKLSNECVNKLTESKGKLALLTKQLDKVTASDFNIEGKDD